MWQIVHNPNITTTVHFVEFSVVELDAELHPQYGVCTTILISIIVA
jgi:hypothetical protein